MTTTYEAGGNQDDRSQHIPGQPDMWFFVLFESLVFTSYFCIYLFFRTQHERAFLQAQSHLLLWLGVLETIVLLTSSWAVVRSVQHARAGSYQQAKRMHLSRQDAASVPRTQDRRVGQTHPQRAHIHQQRILQYYFFLTGIHLLHLLIGFLSSAYCSGSCHMRTKDRKRLWRPVRRTGTPWTSFGSSSSLCCTS